MSIEVVYTLYLVSGLVGLLLLYVVIRLAVRGALRAHEVWMRDGSLERALDAHAAKLADEAERAMDAKAAMRAERATDARAAASDGRPSE